MPSLVDGFSQAGVDSLFIRNSGQYIVAFTVPLFLQCLAWLYLLRKPSESASTLARCVRTLQAKLRSGYSLFLVEIGSLNLMVFTQLQLRNHACKSPLQTFSFLLSYGALYLVTSYIGCCYAIVRWVEQERSSSTKLEKQFGMWYQIFNSGSFAGTGYYLYLAGRKALFAFALVFLNSKVQYNLFVCMALNVITIYYVLQKRPYKKFWHSLRDAACEILFLLMHAFTLFLIDYDRGKYEERQRTTYIIVTLCFGVLAVQAISMA